MDMFSVPLGVSPQEELLGLLIPARLTFWGLARLFSAGASSFYIPTSKIHVFKLTVFEIFFFFFGQRSPF